MQWNRKIVVELFDLDGGGGLDGTTNKVTAYTFTDNRIEVAYNASFAWGADYSKVNIYNLDNEVVASLRKFKNLGIRVYVGFVGLAQVSQNTKEQPRTAWEDILELMFVGRVNTVLGTKRIPDHITELFCIPIAGVFGQKEMKLETNGETKLKDVVMSLCKAAGFIDSAGEALVDFTNVPEDVLNERVPFVTFVGSFIDCFSRLANDYHMWFSITNTKVRLYKKLIKTEKEPDPNGELTVMVKANQVGYYEPTLEDVIGTPTATIGSLSITVIPVIGLSVGDIIDINKLLVTEEGTKNTPFVSGIVSMEQGQDVLYRVDAMANSFSLASLYMICEMTHSMDTHGNTYQTHISALISSEGIADESKRRFF